MAFVFIAITVIIYAFVLKCILGRLTKANHN